MSPVPDSPNSPDTTAGQGDPKNSSTPGSPEGTRNPGGTGPAADQTTSQPVASRAAVPGSPANTTATVPGSTAIPGPAPTTAPGARSTTGSATAPGTPNNQGNFSGPSSGVEEGGPSAADRAEQDARRMEFEAQDRRAADNAAKRQTIVQGLSVAHDNHIKELDGLAAQLASGNSITSAQINALKASAKGITQVIDSLSQGEGTGVPAREQATQHTPGSAGQTTPGRP